jgi:3-oxoacyl-[acyl-carrier protein] reductase
MPSSIVTGSAAGNGLAIARRLRAAGHYVIGIDRYPIPTDAVEFAMMGDVCDPELISRAFDIAFNNGDNNVFLVNNAGITKPGTPHTDAAWDATLEVNLSAPFRWAREYGYRVQSGDIREGGIVFIGSLATQMGFPDNPSYHATKSGVLGLTRSFAFDLGPKGIRVNCVSRNCMLHVAVICYFRAGDNQKISRMQLHSYVVRMPPT